MKTDKQAIFEAYHNMYKRMGKQTVMGYEDDALDGKDFGKPGKFYHVKLVASGEVIDDSDFDREVGYGRKTITKVGEVEDFFIQELDKDGNKLRREKEISDDEESLYYALLDHAKENATVQGDPWDVEPRE
jgi:hypothetical protein